MAAEFRARNPLYAFRTSALAAEFPVFVFALAFPRVLVSFATNAEVAIAVGVWVAASATAAVVAAAASAAANVRDAVTGSRAALGGVAMALAQALRGMAR